MNNNLHSIQAKLMDIVRELDKYEKGDPRYIDWYISAKDYILMADSELSFIIND